MTCSPLFVKYRTRSGNCYVYDPGTNEIVRIGELIYTILNDFQILDTDEMLSKYHSLGKANIREALTQLEWLQSRGILRVNGPQVSCRGTRVVCQGEEEQSLAELLRERRHLLTLELTQQCNLRCEYCCYGEHYPELRGHAEKRMSLETAMNAVKDYMNRSPETAFIGFYGGEPLLEFALLKQIVLFAEAYARQCRTRLEFSITTNGTLLSDYIIRFLVEHEFRVMISLDGTKESHDRYRVFRDRKHSGQRRGSYDVIMKHLQRFVELFPEYPNRGISITLTATSDCDAINDAMKHLRRSFFVGMVSRIRNGADDFEEKRRGSGCHTGYCRGGFDDTIPHLPGPASERCLASVGPEDSGGETSMASRIVPEFRNWTEERRQHFYAGRERFLAEMCGGSDADTIRMNFPLFFRLFWREKARLHLRPIFGEAAKCHFTFRCFPGAARTFCSSEGVLYPCEKTQTGRLFALGDAANGLDVDSAIRLTEVVRLSGDCANCVARKLCPLCPADFFEQGTSGRPDGFAFQAKCREIINALPRMLREYTTAMEANPGLIDQLLQREDNTHGWVDNVRFVLAEEQQNEIELGVEELEPMI